MNNVNNIDNISQVFHENDRYNDRTVTITMTQFPFRLPDKKKNNCTRYFTSDISGSIFCS